MNSTDTGFVEIPGSNTEVNMCFIDAFTVRIEPRLCGSLITKLVNDFGINEDGTLSHLKRVKGQRQRQQQLHQCSSSDPERESVCKKPKLAASRLEVLLGSVSFWNEWSKATPETSIQSSIREALALYDYDIGIVKVGGRPPVSEAEWKAYNKLWPTSYFPEQFLENRQEKLSKEDMMKMRSGILAAIKDAEVCTDRRRVGVVVMDPGSGCIVATAQEEREKQLEENNGRSMSSNTLTSSLVLALQNVSRRERHFAIQQGMDSSRFQSGQYLCTGFDVFSTHEPSVFEAMSAVHARIRRMTIGCTRKAIRMSREESYRESLISGLVVSRVHALPGTNHKFRAFVCDSSSDLAKQCRELE